MGVGELLVNTTQVGTMVTLADIILPVKQDIIYWFMVLGETNTILKDTQME